MTEQSGLGELKFGSLEIRLAQDEQEVRASQALRYRVFYDEMKAKPSPEMARDQRDFDSFDDVADHLLVLDHDRGTGADCVVGTYRLMRRAQAEKAGQFYTADEYDIAKIVAHPGPVLELGRSCVDAGYRNRATMQLLWRGIAAYVFTHDIELMFGCASLHGNDVQALALPLSYLHHHHLAPEPLRPVAVPERYVDMNLMAPEDINPKRAIVSLPPLIKGYLRLGAYVGDGAVIDYQFNTVDVCIVVKTDQVTETYFKHYERAHREAGAG
ncbi:MAG: GNAT family N-acetyltransferase [Alphaproteobacteria bacterium]|nr:GNAT family N-acetyltransferase [Alphaproteobacteria bacterium]